MKKKLYMVDYKGNSDSDNNPIGHPIKVAKEYYKLVKDNFDVTLVMPKNYFLNIKCKSKIVLNYNVILTKGTYLVRLVNIFKQFFNLCKVFKICKNETIWFYDTDFILWVFITLFPKKRNKLVCTVYNQSYRGNNFLKDKIKNFFLYKAINKVDVIIKTNNKINFEHKNIIYIPDYYYTQKYDFYKNRNKKNQMVCLGTINKEKNIEELIECFNNIDIKLIIIGKFFDDNRYQKIKSSISNNENITLENRYLTENEYYTLLAESLYSILPYSPVLYKNRTTGVAVESIFLNTIPISHKDILKFNKIKGIGYENISDLIDMKFEDIKFESFYRFYEEQIEKYYNKNDFITKFFKNL